MKPTERRITSALKRAFKLIDSPEKWTKGTYARDKSGNEVSEASKNATCFCSYGALIRASGATGGHVYQYAGDRLRNAALKFGYGSPISLNDDTDYETVRKMWELAINGEAA